MHRAGLMLRMLALAAATAVGASALRAQQEERTIDPGMTRAQVVERLGKPKGVRSAGEYTYLFYNNGCLKRCGIDDVVTLQGDAVVDAIFRGAGRHYTGTSSSPQALTPAAARSPRRARGEVGGISTSDSTPVAGGAHGGFVVGSPAAGAASETPRAPRGARAARRPRRATTTRPPAARPAVPMPRLSGSDTSGAAAAAAAAGIASLRTGKRTTTGPVDAGAAVKNTGGRLYPSSTPVRPSSGPGADSAAGASAGRVPYQGSKLAPADSAAAVNRRPAPATPPKSDSTRPSPPGGR